MNPAKIILNTLQIPQTILEQHAKLNALVEENPVRIPVKQASQFIGVHEDTLREMIDEGRCPFALGMKKSKYRNRYAVIPTYNFYMWQTQWALIWLMVLNNDSSFLQRGG